MQDLTGKATGLNLTAVEWNELPQEVQNVIETFGASLTSGNLDQLGQAIAMYAGISQFFTGTHSSPNAHLATAISGVQAPTDYINGMMIRFRPSIDNTGAATINVSALGVKSIVKEDASVIPAGALSTTRDAFLRYDSGIGKFRLSNWSSNDDVAVNSSNLKSGLLQWDNAEEISLTPGIGQKTLLNIDGVVLSRTTNLTFHFDDSAEGGSHLDTGSMVASTAYYLYVENVAGTMTQHISVDEPFLPKSGNKVGYHQTEVDWLCIGGFWNGASGSGAGNAEIIEMIWNGYGKADFVNTNPSTDHFIDLDDILSTSWYTKTVNIPKTAISIALQAFGVSVTTNGALQLFGSSGATGTPTGFNSVGVRYIIDVDSSDAGFGNAEMIIPIDDMSTPAFKHSNGNFQLWDTINARVNGWVDVFAPRL
jgi:hypothetical protein